MRRSRITAFALGVCLSASQARAGEPTVLELVADRDDDDANGVTDAEETEVGAPLLGDLVPLDPKEYGGATLHPVSGGDRLRVIVGGRPVAWDRPIAGRAFLQGVLAGRAELVATKGGKQQTLNVNVRGILMRDGGGNSIDLAREFASLERLPPQRIEGGPEARYDDADALRILFETPELQPPSQLSLESLSSQGARLDLLEDLKSSEVPCARPRPDLRCFATMPIRFVIDDVDRNHPLVADRSIKAEVGGGIAIRVGGKKGQMIRVAGPRKSSVGAMGRTKAQLRPFVVRFSPGGTPAIGGSDAGAVLSLRAELAAAASIWGQCGVTFGEVRTLDVRVIDPPPSYLVALGDDTGLPASGGEIRLKVDGRPFQLGVAPRSSPDRVASEMTMALEKMGLSPIVSPNARTSPGAMGSVDVLVRRKDGSPVMVEAQSPGSPLTTDKTLSVRVGVVDLSDGLEHFSDMDAMAGTLEERTLLKAIDDGDPSTIEVVVVPLFAGGGRIGESFIGSDLSSLRNVVLLDRAGIRARKSSLTLAHELGHVLLDQPGHPDDFGVDTPTLLMDSDASDASPFGPRRITVDECARVMTQAGPRARVPVLTSFPLTPIALDARLAHGGGTRVFGSLFRH